MTVRLSSPTNAADNLVALFPDAISQLRGPVFKYLSRLVPFNGTEQDLYMAIMRPKNRRTNPMTPFPADVVAVNPGLNCPQDYIDRLRKWGTKKLDPATEKVLNEICAKLHINPVHLNTQINHESGWNPLAKNPLSGARGLIQFTKTTAASFDYPPYVPPADVTKVDTKPKLPAPAKPLESGKVHFDFVFPAIALAGVGAFIYFKNKRT